MLDKLLALFLLGILLLLTNGLTEASASKLFKHITFTVDFNISHPLRVASFQDPERKQILVMGTDAKLQQLATVYAYDKQTFTQKFSHVIPAKVAIFDLIRNKSGISSLLLLDANELNRLNFVTGKIETMAQVRSIYRDLSPQYLAEKKLVEDLNGDQLEDVMIPDFDTLHIFLQQRDGTFIRQNLAISATADMSQEQMAYLEPRVFTIDVNADKKTDLVVIQDNGMSAYLQQENGSFSELKTRIKLPVQASARPWWLQRTANGNAIDQGKIDFRMLEYLQDMNADGIADLMLSKTSSAGVLDKEVSHEIYYGRVLNGQLGFRLPADSVISTDGTFSAVKLVDINIDKHNELLISSFKIGLGQIIGALLSGSVDQDVYLYRSSQQGGYPAKANFAAEVDLKFSLKSGRTGEPVILLADIDGDSRQELILSRNKKELAVYSPGSGKKLYKSKARLVRLAVPKNGKMITSADLNGDGADELLIHYGKQDDAGSRHKIIVLESLQSN